MADTDELSIKSPGAKILLLWDFFEYDGGYTLYAIWRAHSERVHEHYACLESNVQKRLQELVQQGYLREEGRTNDDGRKEPHYFVSDKGIAWLVEHFACRDREEEAQLQEMVLRIWTGSKRDDEYHMDILIRFLPEICNDRNLLHKLLRRLRKLGYIGHDALPDNPERTAEAGWNLTVKGVMYLERKGETKTMLTKTPEAGLLEAVWKHRTEYEYTARQIKQIYACRSRYNNSDIDYVRRLLNILIARELVCCQDGWHYSVTDRGKEILLDMASKGQKQCGSYLNSPEFMEHIRKHLDEYVELEILLDHCFDMTPMLDEDGMKSLRNAVKEHCAMKIAGECDKMIVFEYDLMDDDHLKKKVYRIMADHLDAKRCELEEREIADGVVETAAPAEPCKIETPELPSGAVGFLNLVKTYARTFVKCENRNRSPKS